MGQVQHNDLQEMYYEIIREVIMHVAYIVNIAQSTGLSRMCKSGNGLIRRCKCTRYPTSCVDDTTVLQNNTVRRKINGMI